MSLTEKQKRLVEKIYENTDTHKTLQEFIEMVCGKSIDDLINDDINKLIKFTKKNESPSERQKQMLRELCVYLDIETPTALTMKEFQDTLELLRNKYDIFIPYYINTSRITYTIQTKMNNYFIGTQHYIERAQDMKVIGFKDIVMVDYDNITLDEVLNKITPFPYTFWVYETTKGYHVYVMSKHFNLQDIATRQEMYKMGCDKWYISFTKCYGTIVRLEPKPGRQEQFVEKFTRQVNNYSILPEIETVIQIKDALIRNNNKQNM
jgi:hypothetical protein